MKAKGPETIKLRLTCIECGAMENVPFAGGRLNTSAIYQACGWLLSIIEPTEPVLAPVCRPCSERVYPPDLLDAAREQFS